MVSHVCDMFLKNGPSKGFFFFFFFFKVYQASLVQSQKDLSASLLGHLDGL